MKNKWLIALGIILAVAFFSNPKDEAHFRAVRKIFSKNFDVPQNKSEMAGAMLGRSLVGPMMDRMIENMVEVDNYLLFSLSKISTSKGSKYIALGLFGQIIFNPKLKDLTIGESSGPRLSRSQEKRRTKAIMEIQDLEMTLTLYKFENCQNPTTEQGLHALIKEPTIEPLAKKWRKGGYLLKNKIPLDPWGNDFIYISPGLHDDFDLMSYGADGKPGGGGMNADITNWEMD